ncbi:MAG: TolC family protein [Acidobacteriota bacterium]|nr:TolC family protein [Acidobacteriota bacterium]
MILPRCGSVGLVLLLLTALPSGLRAQAALSQTPTPTVVTLDEALHLAEANEPNFRASLAASGIARLDKSIAVSALLPSAVYHNQYLYTQGNGSSSRIGQTIGQPTPIYIANNAIHEYASQGVVNETIGLQQFNAVTIASANALRAEAQLEIARRGLHATVVSLYYGIQAADQKLLSAQRAAGDGADFLKRTQEREQARESAHADTIKAQLEQQIRDRALADATLAASKARLELGVLLFPDPRTPYQIEAITAPPVLPDRAGVESLAAKNNAELRSALAVVRSSQAEVVAARAAYLPDLGLNVTYGIDAPQLAVNGPDGVRNLGYSTSATLDIPVWDWFATAHRVKQSELRRAAAKVALTAAQRRAIADLSELYDEATVARDQLASLDLSLSTARESLRLTRLRYAGGDGTVFEVVDAQNALVLAETANADGLLRYETALAQLQTLTGRF